MNYSVGLPMAGVAPVAAVATTHAVWPLLPLWAYVGMGGAIFLSGLWFSFRSLRVRGHRFGK